MFLDAIEAYCGAVEQLTADLESLKVRSRGFRGFKLYLTRYLGSERYRSLAADTKRIKANFRSVQYSVVIRGLSVTVRGRSSKLVAKLHRESFADLEIEVVRDDFTVLCLSFAARARSNTSRP